MLVRNLPLPDENEYRSEILSGIRKEINAAVNKYHPASFNWDAILFFAVPSRYLPSAVFHPDYPFNRETYARISSGFVRSIETFKNSLFFPSLGTKTMGQVAFKEYERSMMAIQDTEIPLDHVTPLAAEICMFSSFSRLNHSSLGSSILADRNRDNRADGDEMVHEVHRSETEAILRKRS